jgi:DNA repair protein RecN (Recombination protein N)
VVAKDERNDRTLTTIRALSADEHIREVAVLMSGESVTDAALTSARQLIERATAG